MINIRSPFRLPLGGGGTDLPNYYKKYGGYLLTAAIDKYMYLAINRPALVDKIMVRYSQTETVNKAEELKHDIARNVLLELNYKGPIHINSMADISSGTGLGSSSAYAVGLIKGILSLQHKYIDNREIAELACKVEIDLCGKPIGKQDQYASAIGGINVLEINQAGVVKVSPLSIDDETVHELESRLLMFYTNIQRDANDILGEQSEKAKVDESVAIQSMHRIKEIGREIKLALENDNVTSFGKLMNEHWLEKKKISAKMSTSNIDKWYETGLANGAIGGKIMGAGGGGFLVFCCETGKRKALRCAMEKEGLKFMDFKFDWEGSKTLVNI